MSNADLSLAEYQRQAARTAGSVLDFGADRKVGMSASALGICGEGDDIDDIVDIVDKHLHHVVKLDAAKLREELGDTLWYVALACSVMGWGLEDLWPATNIAKLRARYPDGFSTQASIDRKDERPLPQRPKIENCMACASHTGGSESQCEWCGGTGLVLEQVKKAWRFWISPVDVYRPSTLKVPDGR